ncbi:hypothetical protein [Amycolatopsis solani]|uniref:hypothetical protein n=1 Tax=Amycolatopsis solani TaxID=3028615 RepID=UPI0025B0166F|nr:hypothetical protein [Amycolatopsis sp. MEP2-6]
MAVAVVAMGVALVALVLEAARGGDTPAASVAQPSPGGSLEVSSQTPERKPLHACKLLDPESVASFFGVSLDRGGVVVVTPPNIGDKAVIADCGPHWMLAEKAGFVTLATSAAGRGLFAWAFAAHVPPTG